MEAAELRMLRRTQGQAMALKLAMERKAASKVGDELDAIGTKRFDSEKAGDREVQRTMLELLNQLDGFSSNDDIKVNSFSTNLSLPS